MRRGRFIGFVQKISPANESKLRKLGARLARETRKIYDSGRKNETIVISFSRVQSDGDFSYAPPLHHSSPCLILL